MAAIALQHKCGNSSTDISVQLLLFIWSARVPTEELDVKVAQLVLAERQGLAHKAVQHLNK